MAATRHGFGLDPSSRPASQARKLQSCVQRRVATHPRPSAGHAGAGQTGGTLVWGPGEEFAALHMPARLAPHPMIRVAACLPDTSALIRPKAAKHFYLCHHAAGGKVRGCRESRVADAKTPATCSSRIRQGFSKALRSLKEVSRPASHVRCGVQRLVPPLPASVHAC